MVVEVLAGIAFGFSLAMAGLTYSYVFHYGESRLPTSEHKALHVVSFIFGTFWPLFWGSVWYIAYKNKQLKRRAHDKRNQTDTEPADDNVCGGGDCGDCSCPDEEVQDEGR